MISPSRQVGDRGLDRASGLPPRSCGNPASSLVAAGIVEVGGRGYGLGWQSDCFTQFRPPRLIIARADEAVEIDRRIFGLLQLAQSVDGIDARGAGAHRELRGGYG